MVFPLGMNVTGSAEAEAYAARFQDEGSGSSWEDAVYGDGTYDSFIWTLQKEHLWPAVLQVMKGRRVALLDFACGTGRVLPGIVVHLLLNLWTLLLLLVRIYGSSLT